MKTHTMHDMNLRSTEFSADGAIDRYQHWIKGANWKNAMTIHDQSLRSKKHHYWAVGRGGTNFHSTGINAFPLAIK